MNLRSVGKTDIGLRRKVNEDSYLIASDLGLYIVADGMGGHKAGEVASRLVVETMKDYWRRVRSGKPPAFLKPMDMNVPETARHLINSIRMTNGVIYEAQKMPQYTMMGSTITALLQDEDAFWLANVGDSPLYLFDRGRLTQITEEHSLGAEQVSMGMLEPEDVRTSPRKHILTRALGLEERVEVFLTRIRPEVGHIILICSDGLTNYMSEQGISTVLDDFSLTLERKADVLIEEAKRRGGGDNISVILLEVLKERKWKELKRRLIVGWR